MCHTFEIQTRNSKLTDRSFFAASKNQIFNSIGHIVQFVHGVVGTGSKKVLDFRISVVIQQYPDDIRVLSLGSVKQCSPAASLVFAVHFCAISYEQQGASCPTSHAAYHKWGQTFRLTWVKKNNYNLLMVNNLRNCNRRYSEHTHRKPYAPK